MFTVDLGAKSSGDPIVPGKTPSTNDTGYIMIFLLIMLSLLIS